MGGVYNFLLKISRFLRASAPKNNIQNDITLVEDLIQRANSMALEAHLMAHDAGVTSTELFTHPHMFRRRTVLESPTVDLPQRDKDGLLVMSLGGKDLFGPDARKVHEWKRDTEEEKIKLISRVFDERDQRDKAKKKPSSYENRPPRSLWVGVGGGVGGGWGVGGWVGGGGWGGWGGWGGGGGGGGCGSGQGRK